MAKCSVQMTKRNWQNVSVNKTDWTRDAVISMGRVLCDACYEFNPAYYVYTQVTVLTIYCFSGISSV